MKLRGKGVPRRRAEKSESGRSVAKVNAAIAKQEVTHPDVRRGGRVDFKCVPNSVQTLPGTWSPAGLNQLLLQPGSCFADAASIRMSNHNHWDMVAASSQAAF